MLLSINMYKKLFFSTTYSSQLKSLQGWVHCTTTAVWVSHQHSGRQGSRSRKTSTWPSFSPWLPNHQLLYSELSKGRRKQGRPLKRYKDCIKANIAHTGIATKQLEERAQDRTGWRALTREATEAFEANRRDSITEARARRKATAEAPKSPGQFPCSHCGRVCRSRLGLHSHQRTHPRTQTSSSRSMDHHHLIINLTSTTTTKFITKSILYSVHQIKYTGTRMHNCEQAGQYFVFVTCKYTTIT